MRSAMLRRTLGVGVATILTAILLAGCTPADSPGADNANAEAEGAPPASADEANGLPASNFMPEVPRISIEKVKARMDAGASMVIVDSRSESSYESSRIPGAVSLPLGDMAEPYDQFDGYEEIVTYCT